MNFSKKSLLASLAASSLILTAPSAFGQNCPPNAACTDPVGFITLTADPSTDGILRRLSLVGLGLFNAVEFQGLVTNVSVADSKSVLDITGVTAAQFDGFSRVNSQTIDQLL